MAKIALTLASGLVVAALVAVFAPHSVAAIDCGTSKSHNAFFGTKNWSDTLLYMDNPKKSSSWLRTVSTDVSTGPLKGTIHYIELLDQNTDGNGGCGYMTGGGVGTHNVSFHIKSQRSYGLNFIVRVYGA